MNRLGYFLPVLLALALTVGLSLTVSHSVGVDIHFHLDIARQYAAGNFAGAWDVFYTMNNAFYPPLFHFLLVPGVWLHQEFSYTLVLQVVFLPLALGLFMLLVYRSVGKTEALVGGLLLLGSMAFVDRVIQPQPQGIDFMLWSLSMLLFLGKPKGLGWVASSVAMAYNHGLVSLSSFGGVFLERLKARDWRRVLLFVLGVLPVVLISFYTLVSALGNYGSRIDTNQEWVFLTDPLYFWLRYVGLPTAGFLIAGYYLVKRKLGLIGKLAVATVACLAVMIPVWPERFAQYAVLPLSLLFLLYFKNQGRRVKFLLFCGVGAVFVWQYVWMWFLTLAGGWQA